MLPETTKILIERTHCQALFFSPIYTRKFQGTHISQVKDRKMTTENNAARFVWRKNGPKPASKTSVESNTWLVKTAICTPDNLEVNLKAGSREFGLHSEYVENKLSELALKRKYS